MEANPIIRGTRETLTTIPPVTRALLFIIVAVFIGQLTFIPEAWVCFGGFWQSRRPSSTSSAKESVLIGPGSWPAAIASFFLSSFAHLGFLHILMNGLVLVFEGGRIEKTIERSGRPAGAGVGATAGSHYGSTTAGSPPTIVNGVIISNSGGNTTAASSNASSSSSYFSLPSASATFLALTVLLVLTTNTSMAILHLLPFSQVNLVNSCVLGLSGVLFGYFAFGCYTAPAGSQVAFCGVVNMPAFLFPWVMLLFTFLLMPSTSFSGHFFGVVWGIAFAKVPFMDALMRRLGRLLGRGAIICPSVLASGGTSRGSSPAAAAVVGYFRHPTPYGITDSGQAAQTVGGGGGRQLGTAQPPPVNPQYNDVQNGNGTAFQMGGAAHPNVAGFGPTPDTAAVPIPPPHGGDVVTGIPIAVGGQQPQTAASFTPFQGEGRKLGGGGRPQ